MQTLGLQGESRRSDSWLKSIFWPTVENAWDVDYLGHQGMWLCLIVAAFQLGMSVLLGGGKLFIIGLGLVGALVYFLAGMGVRERSWPAAAMIFFVSVLEALTAIGTGLLLSPIGALRILLAGLLFSNLRATFIASEWKVPAEGEDRPERFSETFRDKLFDVWPPKAWPILQIPFYALAALWCLGNLFILLGILLLRLGLVHTNGVR